MNGPGPAGVHARGEQAAARVVGYELSLLRAAFRGEFTFGHDPERGYWVIKAGHAGTLLTDPAPDGLGRKIRDTFGPEPS